MADDKLNVEVRKVETEYGETGVAQGNRVDTTWELGAEIDGAWVRFASVAGTTVEALQARAQEQQAAAPAEQKG